MHFSRNPPGPNTSCIEGFADSGAGVLAAPPATPSATVGSSSRGTYSCWAVFDARLSFATRESPAELDTRFARNPPSLSPRKTWRPVTIAYPSASLLSAPRRHRARLLSLLISGRLKVEHATSLCRAVLHYRCVTFSSGIVSVFLSGGRTQIHRRGGHMNRIKTLSFFPLLLLTALSLAACSGSKNRCTTNCGGGTATVSLTLVADTLPANPSILSFKVSILGITLTPTTGTAQTIHPSPSVVDLMRLQSDTAFLGTLTNVPSGSYTIQVSLSMPEITFLNDTGSTITANGQTCSNGAVCSATFTTVGTPTIGSFTITATSGGQQGIGLDFNLKNAISLSTGTLSVNFNPASPNPGVLTAFTLPRTNANLGTNQLELIEDFTGVVSISGNNVTITSNTRGALTATSTSASFFDPSPDNAHCLGPANNFTSCVAKGQIASVDTFLKSDGTLDLKEFEPLNQTQQDFIEGIVYAVNTPTQFSIAVTDKVPAATNPLIGGLNTGDRLTVNIGTQPFLVDSKGLGVQNSFAADYNLFATQTTTSAVHPGQTVAIHVSALTAANPPTLAIATVDTVILRWSRFRANVVSATSTTVNIDTLPSYFAIPASTTQEVVQAFLTGALGTDGVTNLDGVANTTSSLTVGQPVGLRVLYLQNPGNTANP